MRVAGGSDMKQKMKEAGYHGSSSMSSWFEMNEEKVRLIIGNEKQVMQIVEIKTEIK